LLESFFYLAPLGITTKTDHDAFYFTGDLRG
jgi:hypothetical protein